MRHTWSSGAGMVSTRATTVGDVFSSTAPVDPTIRTVSLGAGRPGTGFDEAQPESVTSDNSTAPRKCPAGRGSRTDTIHAPTCRVQRVRRDDVGRQTSSGPGITRAARALLLYN